MPLSYDSLFADLRRVRPKSQGLRAVQMECAQRCASDEHPANGRLRTNLTKFTATRNMVTLESRKISHSIWHDLHHVISVAVLLRSTSRISLRMNVNLGRTRLWYGQVRNFGPLERERGEELNIFVGDGIWGEQWQPWNRDVPSPQEQEEGGARVHATFQTPLIPSL